MTFQAIYNIESMYFYLTDIKTPVVNKNIGEENTDINIIMIVLTIVFQLSVEVREV